ncbi:MAG: ABC-F family ATP-binding cassette domain-containing protein [Myxococcota bacterium]
MISLSDVAKEFGDQTLFEGVTLQLDRGQRYGVVGANGSGKSTLLKLLSGEESPSRGEVSIPRRAMLGVLSQDHFRYEDERILDVVMMGDAPLWSALAEREALLDASEGFDADRYAQLEDVIQRREGYSLEARAGEILEGLGIPTASHLQPLSTLSGGFKLRALLAQVLAARPDVLLLDEPTNHLDIVSIRWLEKFLADFPGTALLVSHDHRFLDNVCTAIVDLDYQTIKSYPGNYRDFTRAKRAERERREREIEKREAEIARNRAFVDRFRAKASKARQAQSKLKVIKRIVIEPLPTSSRRYPRFRFQACRPSGKQVLSIEGVSKSYGDNPVLRDVSLEVARGERVAVIGPNGIGKSTLLKLAMGIVPADAGGVRWGYEAHPGYFAQDHREQLEDGSQTVEAWLWEACPEETRGFVRGQLGAVLFSKDEVKKKLSALSGGEAARLVFARQIVKRPNVLVVDEPTNHLDLEGIEALVEGLRAYDGTLIFVSHDRWFVSELATRVIELTRAGIQDFAGTYEEYLARAGDDHLDATVTLRRARAAKRKGKVGKGKRAGAASAAKRQRKRLEERLGAITGELEACEARLAAIDARFCEAGFFERTPGAEVGQLEAERSELKARADALLREWESLEQQLAPLAEA